jgi:hypothetical protein
MMGNSLQKVQKGRTNSITTLDIDSFIEFATDYAIMPNLLGEQEARKMFTDLANISAGIGYAELY